MSKPMDALGVEPRHAAISNPLGDGWQFEVDITDDDREWRVSMTIAANLHRTRFFFLHHGETDWDRDGKLAGRINAPLNGRGLAQAGRAGATLRNAGIGTICSSPQDRALMTAEIVAAQIHAPIVTIEGLRDCCFGSLDGEPAGGWFEAWQHGVTP